MLNANVQCLNCHESISVSSQDVKIKKAHVNQKDFELMYSICPKCGKEIHLQIDDSWTKQILLDNRKMFIKLAKKRQNFRDISPKENEKFQKKRKNLIKSRRILVKSLNGKTCTDENGEQFVLRMKYE